MANVLTSGNFNRYGNTYTYKCTCGDGATVIYSNSSTACNDCPPSGAVAGGFNANRQRGWKNMSGSNFSAKNFLIYGAIGVAAFFVYNKFIK